MRKNSARPNPLRFLERPHKYLIGSASLHSVTEVIKEAGFLPDYASGDFHKNRGSAVHKMIALDIAGRLDLESTAMQVKKFHKAWRQFYETKKPNILLSEQLLVHESAWYAGTMDMFGIDHYGNYAIWDAKSSDTVKTPAKATAIQIAAYSLAATYMIHANIEPFCDYDPKHPAFDPLFPKIKRYGVMLRPDDIGEICFSEIEYTDQNDYNVWRSALTCLNYKKKLR